MFANARLLYSFRLQQIIRFRSAARPEVTATNSQAQMNATTHERATATTSHERISTTATCTITTTQLPVQRAVARLPQERVGTFLMDHLAYKMLNFNSQSYKM